MFINLYCFKEINEVNTIMINKFDTYSDIMPDYCMDCPA